MTTSLSELESQDEAIILALPKDQRIASRLCEMGLLPGTAITYIRRAPLGDPIEIKLRGYRLSLRKEEATCIMVKKINSCTSNDS